jgi:hypothetical protein
LINILLTGHAYVLSRELISGFNDDCISGFNVATNVTHEIEVLVSNSNVECSKKNQ